LVSSCLFDDVAVNFSSTLVLIAAPALFLFWQNRSVKLQKRTDLEEFGKGPVRGKVSGRKFIYGENSAGKIL
jgi:hypothetical protein